MAYFHHSGSKAGAFTAPLQVDGPEKTEKEVQFPITCGTILSYSHLRLWISSMDLTLRPSRTVTYVEALKMPPGRQGALVAGCKTFDLLIGFIVGKLSDATRTRWGRRMPWIMTFFPLGMLAAILFCSPTLWAFAPEAPPTQPCMEYVDLTLGTGCNQLKTCLEDSFGINETHPSGIAPEALGRGAGGIPSNLTAMSVYFAVFYFAYYMFGWTGSMIPHDALGMELTDDSKSRSLLFGVRGLAQFGGYLFIIVGLQVLAARIPGDVPLQHALLSMVFGVMGLVAVVNLVCGVKERPLAKEEEQSVKLPMVPAIRRLFSNPQYIRYLCMQAPGRLCVLLPANLINLYCKFNLEEENYIPIATLAALAIVAMSFLSAPCVTSCARTFERKNVLLTMIVIQGIGFSVLVALDPETLAGTSPANLLNLCFALFGIGLAGQTIIPEAMLADVIDYDELLTGDRNEGMYTVVETNLVQFVEIIGGVLPLLFMQFGGYVPNNACACGCGVSCDLLNAPYARWICPNDVGFNCRGQTIGDNATTFDDLLFGMDRTAPCVAQNDAVKNMLIFFAYGAPLIFAIISGTALCFYKLTGPVHDQILLEVQRRKADPTYQCTDPLTGKQITLPTNSEVDTFKAYFSEKEWSESQQGGGGEAVLVSLKGSVNISLTISVGMVLAVVIAMLFVGNDYVLSLGFMALAVGVLGVVWNMLRRQALQNPPSAETLASSYVAS